MFFNIIALIPLIAGVYGFIFTLRNKNNMPFGIFGVDQNKCEIISKKGFNNVMIKQSFFMSLYLLLVALFIFIRKSETACVYISLVVVIPLLFSKIAKKYITINKKLPPS